MDTIQKSRNLTRILLIIGLWPRAATSNVPALTLFWRLYPFLLHLPLTFLVTALMWLDAFNSTDLEHTSEVLYIALTESVLLVKIVNMWCHGQRIAQLLREWESLALHNIAECLMWQRAQSAFGIISFIYIICSLSVVFCKTFFAGYAHELPFSFWLPFDVTHHYWCVYAYTLVTMPITCIANVSADMLQCYLMLHVALNFRLTGMRLERLAMKRRGSNEADSDRDQRFFQEFVKIVQLQQSFKRYAKLCERVVTYPILSQIVVSAFVLCCSVYRLKQFDITGDDFMYFFAMVQYAGVMTLQIFLPCYYANEVTVRSQELSMCLYRCDWIGLSPRNRRYILLYMVHLKESVRMHAGPFFEISLQLFSKTMNNAYSLFALLLNMDK